MKSTLALILASLFLSFFSVATFAADSNSCEDSFSSAKSSTEKDKLKASTEACEKATKEACKNMATSGYANVTCEATAAYGADKAVNNGSPTSECKKKYETPANSGSGKDIQDSKETCGKEVDKICGTDDTAEVAACKLKAAHGAFVEVTQNIPLYIQPLSKRKHP